MFYKRAERFRFTSTHGKQHDGQNKLLFAALKDPVTIRKHLHDFKLL